MDTASNPRMSLTVQPEEQVTSTSTNLSGVLFASRPVSSAGAVTTGAFTATAAPWVAFSHNIAVVRIGKLLLMIGCLF